ncbi:transporter substrate-binding domain-containing protein, partial [Arcobacteraceae bacterium]|nr:transporter substrate-binding domain-containing protein [Arcobacteraceae bacterium]
HKILSLINNGFQNISNEELNSIKAKWTTLLNANYLKDYRYKNISLSKKNKEYLKAKKEIRMCVDPSWLPFEAIENGKHIGIISDIYKELQKNLATPFRLIQTRTWTESLLFIKEKKCDILAAAVYTSKRDEYVNFTQAYLEFPEVIITRGDADFIDDFESIIHKKIGIVKNSAIGELIKNKFPKINLIDVHSVSDGLMKVSQGKLYGFLNASASASYYISKEGFTNLKIAAKAGIDYSVRAAVRDDDLELLEILNTLMQYLDNKKIDDISNKYLKVKVQEIVDYTIIYKTIAFFLLIILIILYWNRKLNDEIREKEKLQKELAKLSQVIEQSRVSVIITDLNGKIEYINPYCIEQTGYSKDELLGKNPNILKSGYQNDHFYKDLWSTVKNGHTWQGEFSNKRKDGSVFWESAIIAPIFDENQKIKSFASIKENITDKVIARDKLELAQEEAIKANGAKSEFLAKMSHEIRTPMNAVLGMLYLLEKTQISAIQDNYIKKANHAASSLLGIINDILDFSKIEAGKLDINNREFEFNSMIMDVLSVMSFKSEEKNLELLAYYDNTMPSYIISDKLRVGQILTNLISNAVKFTNSGEVIISTKLIKEKRDDIEIMFCVKDSGIGISPSSQKKLFQEFSQVDSSATRNFEGTGLGLAICKKLSELLGGKIWIEESKENVGSTFCFTVQCKKTNRIVSKKYDDKQISKLKCLVVDDNSSAV